MAETTDFRRFGLAFTGKRPTLKLGDPGIDEAWRRRYRWGIVGGASWCGLLPAMVAIGLLSTWGPFGWIDTWQLETFGFNNVILLSVASLPLAFAPLIYAHLARVDASTPLLFGIRQSFDADWGPRVEEQIRNPKARLRKGKLGGIVVAAVGAIVACFFAAKGFSDADAPHAPLPELAYARFVDPHQPLDHAVRLVGVTADKSRLWAHDYSIRQDTHRDVYYPLRPLGENADVPASVVELDQTSPQYDVAPWNMVDAPGLREGLPELLDDWTAQQLRRAGVPLAPRVIVLKREQLHGRDPRPDPTDDVFNAMFAGIAVLIGLFFSWGCCRAEKNLGVGTDELARP